MTREGTQDWPIAFETDRLLIRPPAEADRESYIRLYTDPEMRKYLGGVTEHASRQALELSPLGLTWGQWVLTLPETNTVVGCLSFTYDRGELELSYALLPEYEGFGYAAEACNGMLSWASENLEDDHVIAVTESSNKRSVHLLKRLGFTLRKGLEEFGGQQFLMHRPLVLPAE